MTDSSGITADKISRMTDEKIVSEHKALNGAIDRAQRNPRPFPTERAATEAMKRDRLLYKNEMLARGLVPKMEPASADVIDFPSVVETGNATYATLHENYATAARA